MALTILSWNIQGSLQFPATDFRRIAPVLDTVDADILCLQEAQILPSTIDSVSRLQQHHHVVPQRAPNGNHVVSRHPIVAWGELEFPRTILPTAEFEHLTWVEVAHQSERLRIYNCHLGIRGIGPRERAAQLVYVLTHAATHIGPTIICGDMNTTIPAAGVRRTLTRWFHGQSNEQMLIDGIHFAADERHPFAALAAQHGFEEAIDLETPTWSFAPRLRWELFKVKLDWFLVRGMEKPRITLGPYISDHRSVLAEWV